MTLSYSNLDSIFSAAAGRWPEILESLGINPIYLKIKHGPCPACGGKDRFKFDDKGRGAYFCNKCGAGNGIQLLQLCFRWSFTYALNRVVKMLGVHHTYYSSPRQHYGAYKVENSKNCEYQDSTKNEYKSRKERLARTWQAAQPISANDPVDRYLKQRGITLSSFPDTLRFHPSLPYHDDERILIGKFPAMLAPVTNPKNRCVSIHRTYLGDGCKANVKPHP